MTNTQKIIIAAVTILLLGVGGTFLVMRLRSQQPVTAQPSAGESATTAEATTTPAPVAPPPQQPLSTTDIAKLLPSGQQLNVVYDLPAQQKADLGYPPNQTVQYKWVLPTGAGKGAAPIRVLLTPLPAPPPLPTEPIAYPAKK